MKFAQLGIPDKLKELRQRANLSQAELARLLGTSLIAIDQWERSNTLPSKQQQRDIANLLAKAKGSEKLQLPAIVLQNGSFASRGSTRQALSAVQPDLFTEQPPAIALRQTPTPPLLSMIKTGKYFQDGEHRLKAIFAHHRQPAKTAQHAVKLGVSAGKNTYTYDAHTYHTKVPPQGIVEFIENYLPEGGVVLDPFAGSGMTGVAARIAGVDVILNELSPAACFISHNFTETISPSAFGAAINSILSALTPVRKALYTTTCRECGKDTEILYTVWSYRVLCPHCSTEFTLWDHCRQYGHTVREHKILSEFRCPACGVALKKRTLPRTTTVPVMLGYKCCGKAQIEHPPTLADLDRIASIESGGWLAEGFFPTVSLPDGVNLNQPKRHGLDRIDRLYTRRNLAAMSQLWRAIHCLEDAQLALAAAFVFTSLYQRVTRLSEFRFWGGSGNTARFNVPFIFNEANVFVTFERKAASVLDHLETTAVRYRGDKAILCNSATHLDDIPDESIDFIFTDPPFGANINYSEMNILWESWLGEYTDATYEAIVSQAQGKTIADYQRLMELSLAECYRVLRPGHWLLLVFMNSSKQIWDAIKQAVQSAGFITERLDIFDKQHGTFKQFVSDNTAGCDLVLHCRKPAQTDARIVRQQRLSSCESIARFLETRDEAIPITAYLHVARHDELDLRRLYSEWLAVALPRDHELTDFAEFRRAIMQLLERHGEKAVVYGRPA